MTSSVEDDNIKTIPINYTRSRRGEVNMKGIVGLLLFMIGGCGLDSEGIGFWICAAMALVGLVLLSASENEIEEVLHERR